MPFRQEPDRPATAADAQGGRGCRSARGRHGRPQEPERLAALPAPPRGAGRRWSSCSCWPLGVVCAPLLDRVHDPTESTSAPTATARAATTRSATDSPGRDVFSRLLYAGRVSLSVGLVAVAIYTAIGIVLGALAGFYGGWVDSVIMRLADIVLSFPTADPDHHRRLGARPEHLQRHARDRPARLAADRADRARRCSSRCASASSCWRAAPIGVQRTAASSSATCCRTRSRRCIVAATFGMANAILLEAGLSFLGLGVQPPTPSWGNMLTDAQSLTVLESMPWLWIPPGMMIALAVLSINFIGDGLRDALDPYMLHR